MNINIGGCPNCGGECESDSDRFYGGIVRWQIRCANPVRRADGSITLPGCGYAGPMEATEDEAARKHNKMSQMCGASGSRAANPVDVGSLGMVRDV